MPTLNYTTKVPATRTVAEIQTMLGRHGASAVAVRYTDGRPTGVSFTAEGVHGARAYTLPCDVDAMHKVLDRQWRHGEIPPRYATPEHAERVAWRVIKDWLEAQLALVAAQMATLEQAMLPHMHESGMDSPTMFERYVESGPRRIEA